MDCYVVLWIPTIVYNDFSASIKTSLEKNISDIPDRELIVKVDLLGNGSFNVFIKSVEQYDLLVELKREQVSSNGLMMFSYKSTSNKESGFRFNSTEFPSAIYHMIKSFYHVHDFHDDASDSSLAPFVTSQKIDIQSDDNEALQHYLTKYSDIISSTVGYLRLAIRKTRENKEEIRPETRSLFQQMCLYAKGYEVYMGVLYRSKYNTLCKIDGDDRGWRHKACNIENGLRYIRTIEREYGEYTQQKFVDKVIKDAESSLISSNESIQLSLESIKKSKIANIIGIVSIFIGIASLIVAFIIAQQSTKELKEVKDSLKQDIEIIPTSLLETESKVQTISLKQDSLQKNNLEIQEQLQTVSKRVDDLFWVLRKQSD